MEETQFQAIVATFADANPNGSASDFTATIDWGDGSAVDANTTIVPNGEERPPRATSESRSFFISVKALNGRDLKGFELEKGAPTLAKTLDIARAATKNGDHHVQQLREPRHPRGR